MRQLLPLASRIGVTVGSIPTHLDPIAIRALPINPEYSTRLREATLAGKYFAMQKGYQLKKVREVIEFREELELERILTDLKSSQELLQAKGWGHIIPKELKSLTAIELKRIIQDDHAKRIRPEVAGVTGEGNSRCGKLGSL